MKLATISDEAFKDSPKLQFVKLPSALTTLGANAFSNTKLAQPSNIDWNGLSCNDLVAGGAPSNSYASLRISTSLTVLVQRAASARR